MTDTQALDEIDQILEDVDVFAFGSISKEERVEKAKQQILKLVKEARRDELNRLLNNRTFEPVITPQAIQDRLKELSE